VQLRGDLARITVRRRPYRDKAVGVVSLEQMRNLDYVLVRRMAADARLLRHNLDAKHLLQSLDMIGVCVERFACHEDYAVGLIFVDIERKVREIRRIKYGVVTDTLRYVVLLDRAASPVASEGVPAFDIPPDYQLFRRGIV